VAERAEARGGAAVPADVAAAAAALYSPDLPYHNFGHALETLATAESILARCAAEGIRIDAEVVLLALLFHDAGYRQDHEARGFATKEAYAAQLAADALGAHGYRPAVIGKVRAAILSTHRDAEFRTAEQKAVRAADLAGLAADYRVFRANTVLLHEESQLLSGRRSSWAEWIESVTQVLRFYLRQEIRLTSYFWDEQGRSVFHRRAAANLARLRRERNALPGASGA